MVFHDFYYEDFAPRYGSEEGFVLGQLRPENVSELLPVLDLQSRNETLFAPIFDINASLARLNRGEQCFFSRANGKLANYIWFCPNDKHIPEIQCTLRLRPDEVYVYNAYVIPEYRKKNINVLVHDFARSRMIEAGFNREIIARMVWNTRADYVLQEKLGARAIGSVAVGFFLSFRYVIRNVEGVELIDEAGPFEFYKKLFLKIKNILKTPGAAASY